MLTTINKILHGTIGLQNITIPTLVNVPEDPRKIFIWILWDIRRKFVRHIIISFIWSLG
jgi:hypothetical protein